VRAFAVASSVLAVLSTTAVAQQPVADHNGQSVFRSGASLVALNVTVTDGKRFVGGLQSTDFEIYEDGVRQAVQFFDSSGIPVDLILLLDTSASMRDKMTIVHEAALGFLRTLRQPDRGAIVAFNDGVDVLQTLTSDRDLLASAVNRTQPRGATALRNALYVAMKQFGRLAQQTGDVRRQAIALLTDGQDTSSLISFEDVLALARKIGVNIYTIALRSDSPVTGDRTRHHYSESDYSMKMLATETGGQAFFPDFVQDLKGVYAVIADELSNQYSIGYSPSNARADGRFRRVVVKMASRPELRPRARPGYTAEAQHPAIVSQNPR
jgi:Ca-activated chloride channel family protein